MEKIESLDEIDNCLYNKYKILQNQTKMYKTFTFCIKNIIGWNNHTVIS